MFDGEDVNESSDSDSSSDNDSNINNIEKSYMLLNNIKTNLVNILENKN